jgi:hypothetical protein
MPTATPLRDRIDDPSAADVAGFDHWWAEELGLAAELSG